MAKNSPITFSHGWFVSDDNAAEWTVKDSAGVAVDISGWTFEWVLKHSEEDPDAVLSYTNSDSELGFKTDGTDGIIRLDIPDTDTDQKDPGTYFYSLRRTNSGSEKTVAYGSVALPASAASTL